ncbi:MAG: hypothetical protein OXQ29_08980 [Rhodospirillaceae bacterium]|nr:hypothetical protein [Rhodospirillaceae bacterium]
MNTTSFNTWKLKAMILASILFLVIGAVTQASAESSATCAAAWENASANDYCSKITMHWTEPDPGQTNGCQLVVSCNVNVSINGVARTFARNFGVLATPNDMGTLDLCFRQWEDPLAIDGWVLFIKLSCAAPDVDVDTAVADGLGEAT